MNYFMNCRVCGLVQSAAPWGDDGACGSSDICDCCGTEFGYEDNNVESARAARRRWVTSGYQWFAPKLMPMGWSVDRQLAQIPPEFL